MILLPFVTEQAPDTTEPPHDLPIRESLLKKMIREAPLISMTYQNKTRLVLDVRVPGWGTALIVFPLFSFLQYTLGRKVYLPVVANRKAFVRTLLLDNQDLSHVSFPVTEMPELPYFTNRNPYPQLLCITAQGLILTHIPGCFVTGHNVSILAGAETSITPVQSS
jgi:hypothetical protein